MTEHPQSDRTLVYHDPVEGGTVSGEREVLDVVAVDAVPEVFGLYCDSVQADDLLHGDVTDWVIALPDGRVVILPRQGTRDVVFTRGLDQVIRRWAPLHGAELVSVAAARTVVV